MDQARRILLLDVAASCPQVSAGSAPESAQRLRRLVSSRIQEAQPTAQQVKVLGLAAQGLTIKAIGDLADTV